MCLGKATEETNTDEETFSPVEKRHYNRTSLTQVS